MQNVLVGESTYDFGKTYRVAAQTSNHLSVFLPYDPKRFQNQPDDDKDNNVDESLVEGSQEQIGRRQWNTKQQPQKQTIGKEAFFFDISKNSVELIDTPGVGFNIGSDLVNSDGKSEIEMAKKKESIMMQSLRRRADQEAKRIAKEQQLAQKREEERMKREEQERKREEERIKKQLILEQYRQRKAEEQLKKDISGTLSRDSSRSNSTLTSNRSRAHSAGKPRPKSLHVSSTNIQDFSSLDCKPSRIGDDVDNASYLTHSSNMNSNSSRPQSSMSSGQSGIGFGTISKNITSPNHNNSQLPSLPPFMLGRHRGPPSDGASDICSTFSEYNGPKLFVKPSQKSNKVLILNAINVVLAGAVSSDLKKRVIEV